MADDARRVEMGSAQGSVLGNHNVQHNHFYTPTAQPAPPAPPVRPARPAPRANPRRRAAVAAVVAAVLAAVGVCGYQALIRFGDLLPDNPFSRKGQIIQDATGPGPWTVEGYGYRYTVEKAARTRHEGQGFKQRDSLTITGYVTVTRGSDFAHKDVQVRDQADNLLEALMGQGEGTGDPPVNQRTKLVTVVWDAAPRATTLTLTVHDFYWSAGQDLILRGIPTTT